MNQLGVCVILKNKTGEIALGRRKNGYMPGVYGLPGGRVEFGERLVRCAKRELHEECAISDVAVSYVGFIKEKQSEQNFIHFVFFAYVDTKQLKNNEPNKCEGWKWFTVQNLPKELVPGHRAALELLKTKTEYIEL